MTIKIIIIFIFSLTLLGCQRGKLNELSVDFNKSLIIPPIYDLPSPKNKDDQEDSSITKMIIGDNQDRNSNENLVKEILKKTNSDYQDGGIRDQIDYESGYKNEDGFFEWLLRGKSKRENLKDLKQVVDPYEDYPKDKNN